MWEKCPICNGTGKEELKSISNGEVYKCPVCKGKCIISNLTGKPPENENRKLDGADIHRMYKSGASQDKIREAIESIKNSQQYLYPPESIFEPGFNKSIYEFEKVNGTKRPSHMFCHKDELSALSKALNIKEIIKECEPSKNVVLNYRLSFGITKQE